ncbi:MAG: sigma-54-dependent Fis family transcriptional regulator [Planctomycetes bacterium]|nr:sigma-54-dependent Fis family transcriptional regulator [Planctomycetota bacterium]
MAQLLIVDDDPHIRQSLLDRLASRGYDVAGAGTVRDAYAAIRRDRPDLVLLDLSLPDGDGVALLERLRAEELDVTVVVITAFGTVERAVAAMKAGAYDFIQKPFEPSLVEETIRRGLERTNLRRENSALRLGRADVEPVIADPRTREVFELAGRAARTGATILLLGESGTGKEVLAREIHRKSPRAAGPFIAVNCVALPEGLLESELFGHEKGAFTGAHARRIGKIEAAHRGTLFLDEIGDIPAPFQAKLLRVLQERTFERVGGNEGIAVDLRVVAATHRDLKARVADGRFREDLYYRLNVVVLPVPPLRERGGDVRELVRYFLEQACREAHRPAPRVAEPALALLEAYPWPGNVRELKNVVERTVALFDGEEVGAADLPQELLDTALAAGGGAGAGAADPAGGGGGAAGSVGVPGLGDFHARVADYRKRLILEALERAGGNQTRAADALGLQRTYLARLIKQLGLRGGAGAESSAS